jgi:chromosome segregation ATPase
MAILTQDEKQKLDTHRAEKAQQKQENSSNEKKFTDEELSSISSIKQNYDSITLRMGQLHFELSALQTEKENLNDAFQENRKSEVEFAQTLTTKYGKGSLDIETGIFTPSDGI